MGLPRMGILPGTSNEPPGMRQETVSGQTQRVSLPVQSPGHSPFGTPATGPACTWEEREWNQVLRVLCKPRKVEHCGGMVAQSKVDVHPVLRRLGIAETLQTMVRIRIVSPLPWQNQPPKHSGIMFLACRPFQTLSRVFVQCIRHPLPTCGSPKRL